MIVEVRKYLIYGVKEEMEKFFELAQKGGFLEFIGIWQKKALELPLSIRTLVTAIKALRVWSGSSSEIKEPTPSDVFVFADKVVVCQEKLNKLQEEQRVVEQEIELIAPFGTFQLEDIEKIHQEGRRIVQYFCCNSDFALKHKIPSELIYITTEYDLDYYISISKEKIHCPKMIEITMHRSLAECKERLQQIVREISESEGALRASSVHLPFLQSMLRESLNEHQLQSAKHDVSYPLGDTLFAIEAWVPANAIYRLFALVQDLKVSCDEIAVEQRDRVPTYMENKGFSKMGEDLVLVYDTPAPTDPDPSRLVMISFALFFAMIIADAGYGLIYFLIMLVMWWKFPKVRGMKRRLMRMGFLISIATMVWGVLTVSFFGVEIGPQNPMRKSSLLHYLAAKKASYHIRADDDVYHEMITEFPGAANARTGHDLLVQAAKADGAGNMKYEVLDTFYGNILMEIALLIGMIHICLGCILNLRQKWAGAGWIAFIIGGYLFIPSMLNATSLVHILGIVSKAMGAAIGSQLLWSGIAIAVGLTMIQKGILAGLNEILKSIEIFADVLSYLRLYALALASMIVASTFNNMGVDIGLSFGWFFGILIILIGHLLNIVMSSMGGVIHGLRLNFLEWYHYCFEGDGKKFNPLHKHY